MKRRPVVEKREGGSKGGEEKRDEGIPPSLLPTRRERLEAAESVELEEWDPTTLPDNFFLVLEGKRRTGKSTFAKWLLQWYQDRFALVWVMTRTKVSGYWQDIVGEQFTFDDFYPSAIGRLLERNDALVKKYGEESEQAKELGSTLIILDDVISGNVHNDPIFKLLAVEGRHHLLSIILMTQDPKAISPLVRDNADLAVVFNQKTFRNKESIWSDFMNDIPKETAFALLLRYAIEHNALICVQTNLNTDINKNFSKSTGDKTKLWAKGYALGSDDQKSMVFQERRQRELVLRRNNAGPIQKIASSDIWNLSAPKIMGGQ